MSNKNIAPTALPPFEWIDGQRLASLVSLRDAICEKIDGSLDWYQTKRVWKRRLAWCFRVGAIILGTIATILPTIAEMTKDATKWPVPPSAATILGIVVGALVMLDKLIGASSAWIRYTMAETALKEMHDELELAFTLEAAAWAGQPEPTVEQTKHAFATLQGFLTRANQVVRDETVQWKTEFQSALQQSDEALKVAPRKIDEVVGVVKIANPERLVGPWSISIDGGPEESVEGDSKSFHRTPGPIIARVKAKIKSGADGREEKPFATEVTEHLAAGAAKTLIVNLPAN